MSRRGSAEPQATETIIGKETEFKGVIRSHGLLRVDGRLEGEVMHQGDLVVGEQGSVVATIKAQNVTVAGEVKGNVDADGRLEMLPSGRLFGDIRVGYLVVAEGAIFQGMSQMKGEERPVPRVEPKPPPAPPR
ncbi:MAG: polymer-forming cytoskeletal protein [Acetobacteraceae bacterium]|nr:polymer-forming cytoskeletal protein [Acetobacteraceae bacterium]